MNSTGLSIPAVEPFRQGDDFGRWLRGVQRYLCAVGTQEADRKCAVLLHLVEPDVADLSETLPEETSETADSFERLKRKLTTYLSPRQPAPVDLWSTGDRSQSTVTGGRVALMCPRRGELQRKLVREAVLKGDDLTLEDVRRTARAHRDVMDLTTRVSGAPVPAAMDGEAVQVDRLPLVTLSVNGRETEMMVDTGSPVSIVADGSIPGLKLRPSKMQLRSFTGQPVPVHGEATVQAEYGGQRKRLNVVVSGQLRHHPLLGRDWLREIRLDWRSLLQVSEASKDLAGLGLELADHFLDDDEQLSIDILCGLDVFWTLVKPGATHVSEGLALLESVFGWILSGVVDSAGVTGETDLSSQVLLLNDLSESTVRSFWELEALGIGPKEDDVENDPVLVQFEKDIEFNESSGRYKVKLPWKRDVQCENVNGERAAERRLDALNRKLSRNPDLKDEYDQALEEMERNGVIQEIPVTTH
ncbi:hypothetical protein FJT64_025724 [Amphibalanus amphitrite]|uniref:Peptidase A2 domain-containing protein n=1 Tax=Amphibalanus amphitrite TaxID=1232801 RepID=A0A6A4WEY6_AMPAM|nr:hypothetical protein FJT64_025724 [Amphibalanus amphitrite]